MAVSAVGRKPLCDWPSTPPNSVEAASGGAVVEQEGVQPFGREIRREGQDQQQALVRPGRQAHRQPGVGPSAACKAGGGGIAASTGPPPSV